MNNYCEICNKNKGNIYYYHKQIGYEFKSFKRYNQEIGTYSGISTSCIVCDDCIKEFKFKSIGFSLIMIVSGIILGIIGNSIFNILLRIDDSALQGLEAWGCGLLLASSFIIAFYIGMICLIFFSSKNNIGDHVAGAYRTGHKMIPLFLYYGTFPSYKIRKDFEALKKSRANPNFLKIFYLVKQKINKFFSKN